MKRNILNALVITLGLIGAPALAASATNTPAEASSQPVSDMFLKGRVVSALTFNRHISIFDFDTKVENGVAYISGIVDTPVERDIAVEAVRGIDDIKDVRADIEVKSGVRKERETLRRSLGQSLDDAGTTAAVKSKLLANQSTGGLGIKVTTKDNVVTLSGKVKSEAERDLAAQIAENSDGVVGVNNDLKVK